LILTSTDCLITLVLYAISLGIGYLLLTRIKTPADFFSANRELPAWLCALAFAAGLGAQEVLALGAAAARYGVSAAAFYSLGAIPGLLFAGLFIVPLLYASKARTLPEFLGLRFDSKTRTLLAAVFALTTLVTAAASLALIARILQALHIFDGLFRAMDWPLQGIFLFTAAIPALVVLGYVLLGGLRGVIRNLALQLFVLIAGLLPVVFLGLKTIGGWPGLIASLAPSTLYPFATGSSSGLHLALAALALGLVLGAGYACTDFRLLQIPLAAKTSAAARQTPLLAAIPRLVLPVLLILPGLIAIALPTPHTTTFTRIENGAIFHETTVVRPEAEQGNGLVPATTDPATGKVLLDSAGQPILNYEMVTPNLLAHVLPNGLLGLGLTALLAALMSSLALSVSAFAAVFTCDLYQPFLSGNTNPAPDAHLLAAGRWSAVACAVFSIAAAWAALGAHNLIGLLLLAFSVLNAPLFATILLGIFWKRATGHGAFAGLLAGAAAALLHYGLTLPVAAHAGIAGAWLAVLHVYPSEWAQFFWTAISAFTVNLFVMIVVSLLTPPRPQAELVGLVHNLDPRPRAARSRR